MNESSPLRRYIDEYLTQAQQIINQLNRKPIEDMINILLKTRQSGGRLFILGVGGGAGHRHGE